jgi:hypothetical protein
MRRGQATKYESGSAKKKHNWTYKSFVRLLLASGNMELVLVLLSTSKSSRVRTAFWQSVVLQIRSEWKRTAIGDSIQNIPYWRCRNHKTHR